MQMRDGSRLGLSGKPGTRDFGDISILGRAGSDKDAARERRLVNAVTCRKHHIVIAVERWENTNNLSFCDMHFVAYDECPFMER